MWYDRRYNYINKSFGLFYSFPLLKNTRNVDRIAMHVNILIIFDAIIIEPSDFEHDKKVSWLEREDS